MRTAVLLPASPLLLRGVGGRSDPAADLRSRCLTTLTDVLAGSVITGPALLVTAGPDCREWTGAAFELVRLTGRRLGSDQPNGVDEGEGLPRGLAVGAALLSEAGWTGEVRSWTTDGSTAPSLDDHQLLLVLGDGSALRRPGGPDVPSPQAHQVDEEIRRAVTDGDPGPLRSLSAPLAEQLMITGAPAWRWLAGVTGTVPTTDAGEVGVERAQVEAELDYADDPFGVFTMVARWRW